MARTVMLGAWARFFGACLLAMFTKSCGTNCNAIGCSDGVALDVHAPDGVWPDGVYTLKISLDAETHDCEVTLPDGLSNPSGGNPQVPCTPSLPLWFVRDVINCSENGTQCQSDPTRWHIQGRFSGTPEVLKLTLSRDSTVLIDEQRALEYHEVSPNGFDCGPRCRGASASFAFE